MVTSEAMILTSALLGAGIFYFGTWMGFVIAQRAREPKTITKIMYKPRAPKVAYTTKLGRPRKHAIQ